MAGGGSFDEALHPRAPDGKFGSGAGGAAGKKSGAGKKANGSVGGASGAVPSPKPVSQAKAKAAADKAALTAAKEKAKGKAAQIVASAKAKAAQVVWKGKHDAAKQTAALKAGKVADPKAAKAKIAAARVAAKEKAAKIVAAAKERAKATIAKAKAAKAAPTKAGKGKTPVVAPKATPTATPAAAKPSSPAAKPMTDQHLEVARQKVLATANAHEVAAAMTYSGHSYEDINTALRTNDFKDRGLSPDELHTAIGHLDSLMAKSKIDSPVITYRTSGEHPAFANLKPGDSFVDHAFVSTTTNSSLSNLELSTGEYTFHITSPSGTKMAGIPSKFPQEKEMLLGRGTAFRLDKRERTVDQHGVVKHVLHVTVIGQK